MYLTKMPINRRRRGAGKLLSYPQAMHAAVESAFPPKAQGPKDSRPLWRVDSPTRDETYLYIVSATEPDLSHVVEQAGWQTGDMWQTRSYLPVLDGLRPGGRYAFRLRANPVRSARKTPDGDTKPVAHVSEKYQLAWLTDRAESRGFEIPDDSAGDRALRIVERGTMRFGKSGQPPGAKGVVTIGFATYEGILVVSDADVLRGSLISGIGRAKAYGCGLMTLAHTGSRV
ncbi:type I-E CRISPR-associated protein Cas6/Cse3/CasE [Gordonia sp. NPDC003585]|uniref:type I-E CRISPR-associated protein Cas6/Cse3/CasE n=1 Tax=Gordonia sp. NPDC003585 TaxID=3154275 RepID=UPI0033A4FA80